MKDRQIPLVTMIMPVYNAERNLRKSVDCLTNQTLENIEILFVDDCSTDRSADILKEYQEKDSRVRYISHNVNTGVGGARNTGVLAARGEYIGFMDNDDLMSIDFTRIMYEKAKESDSDIVMCGSKIYTKRNGVGNHCRFEKERYITDPLKIVPINEAFCNSSFME